MIFCVETGIVRGRQRLAHTLQLARKPGVSRRMAPVQVLAGVLALLRASQIMFDGGENMNVQHCFRAQQCECQAWFRASFKTEGAF